jgi:hypothetical protein
MDHSIIGRFLIGDSRYETFWFRFPNGRLSSRKEGQIHPETGAAVSKIEWVRAACLVANPTVFRAIQL